MASYRVIVAGGTIDAEDYNFARGVVLSFGDPAIGPITQTGGVVDPLTSTRLPFNEDADILILEQKDSSEMTDTDRIRILILCLLETRKQILITHGTDTMIQTGLLLSEHVEGKTILLSGAMRPYRSESSDAPFNIGGAIAACQALSPGVWIVMNGKVLPIKNVRKVKEAERAYFTEKDPHYRKRTPPDARKVVERLLRMRRREEIITVKIPRGTILSEPVEHWVGDNYNPHTLPREGYWTAGCHPRTLERYFAPVNHHCMYVLGGSRFGMKGEIFVQTGNGIIGLPPRVFVITHRAGNKERIVFLGKPLGVLQCWLVLFSTRVQQVYWRDKALFRGIDVYACRQRKILQMAGELSKKKSP